MPVEWKKDLLGSSKTRSYGTTRSRAERRFIVRDNGEGLFLNDNEDLDKALDAFETEEGLYHPTDNGLPLDHTTVTRWGPDKLWLTAYYRYREATGSFDPVNRMVASYEPAYESVPVYRSAWRPEVRVGVPPDDVVVQEEGYYFDWDPNKATYLDASGDPVDSQNTGLPWGQVMLRNDKPVMQMLPRPIERIQVATTLYYNPFGHPSYIGNYRDTINSTTVVFGTSQPQGIHPELRGIFGPECLRFDGALVQQRTHPSGVLQVWDVRYQFSMMKGKWYKQEIREEGDIVGPPSPTPYFVSNRRMYLAVDFAGAFPVQAAPNYPG